MNRMMITSSKTALNHLGNWDSVMMLKNLRAVTELSKRKTPAATKI